MSCNNTNLAKVNCTAAYSGYDYKLKIDYTSLDSSTAIDLTGSTVSMIIQAKRSDVDLLSLVEVNDTISTGILVPDPLLGVFYIQIRKADTTPLSGDYDYRVNILDSLGDTTLLMYGGITFIKVS
tara:strand:- start:654 stop:1028 length:375 start_codon:yes stop_codon:yes gene_type:complete